MKPYPERMIARRGLEGMKVGVEVGDRVDFIIAGVQKAGTTALFDYLSDRICRRLLEIFYDLLAPGGLLVATNVDISNPSRNWMEHVVDWHLVYRNQEGFIKLAPDKASPSDCKVSADATGVNIFLEIRKPEHA